MPPDVPQRTAVVPTLAESCAVPLALRVRRYDIVRILSIFRVDASSQGCEVSCPSSNELARHHRLPRHVGDTLRPTIAPVPPKLSSIPLPELGVRPIWMLDTPLVKQPAISSQLHQWLAPRVRPLLHAVR